MKVYAAAATAAAAAQAAQTTSLSPLSPLSPLASVGLLARRVAAFTFGPHAAALRLAAGTLSSGLTLASKCHLLARRLDYCRLVGALVAPRRGVGTLLDTGSRRRLLRILVEWCDDGDARGRGMTTVQRARRRVATLSRAASTEGVPGPRTLQRSRLSRVTGSATARLPLKVLLEA